MADAGTETVNGTGQPAGSVAWQDLLVCPVCQDAFTDPKLLPCLHTFCRDCLANSLEKSGISPGQAFLCPICKNPCSVPNRGVDALKTNIFLVTLQEFMDRKLCTEDQTCDGCKKGAKVARRCIECKDWLCAKCCTLHARVNLTKDHHLHTPAELLSGECDELLKEHFEPLTCSKHINEPLRLYCVQQSCQAPICTVCKTTLGHDGHITIELDEQAALEANAVVALTPNLEDSITAVKTKIANVLRDEKMTNHVRKRVHRAINERLEEVVERLVTQVGDYADTLHREVEAIAKKHQKALSSQLDDSKNRLHAMLISDRTARALLDFGRSEEMVAMAHDVRERLHAFQSVPDTQVDGWRQPRLNPPSELQREDIALMFGTLTFAGEVTRSVLVHSFSARLDDDTRTPALCDITVSDDNEIVVVDRDNRTVKVFDSRGGLRRVAGKHELRAPNRIALLRRTKHLLVKDEKVLKLIDQEGGIIGKFAEKLQQPVGVAQTSDGDVLVTDWVTSAVHVFDELATSLRHFPCACEAPGYVAAGPGVVVLSDWKQDQVKMFARDGAFLYQYGKHGSGPGQLDHPYGVCVDRYGHVIVADTWNNRIHLVSEDGKFIRFLVTKEDGLQWPQGVTIDRKGNLVVVEQHGQVKIYKYIA